MNEIEIRSYTEADLPAMTTLWNHVVREGCAFPQCECLSLSSAADFFAVQSFTGVAEVNKTVAGLYILHPNNVGRCGHLANASYAVDPAFRGRHIGEKLVRHSLKTGKELGFRILQFNAVVTSNLPAICLYQKLGFVSLGIVPGGFLNTCEQYEDIQLFYYVL